MSAVLAVLLLSGVISAPVSGSIFAVALVVFGILSRGFGRRGDPPSGPPDAAGNGRSPRSRGGGRYDAAGPFDRPRPGA